MSERFDAVLDRCADLMIGAQRRMRWLQAWWAPITGAALVCLAIVALAHMESSGPNYDPQYMRVLVERTMRFGGSYYENGIHNKGPLEPLVYELAGQIGGHDGFWFVLGVGSLVAALCIGSAAAIIAIRSGASQLIGWSVAAAAVAHFTLSDADYAGVLYARNMTVAMLSVAFVVAFAERCWATPTRRMAAVVVIGVSTGLAVQTLLTTAFTASAVLLWAMWHRRSVRIGGRPAWLVMASVSAAALVIAPIYYRVVGPWQEFSDGWWVYARFMSEGTGRSLGSQVELGWTQIFDYYRERPELVVICQLWLVSTAFRWHRLDGVQRSIRLLTAAWFVGAWIEMVLSQRYSSHYFSIIAVPTVLMLATLIGQYSGRVGGFLQRRPSSALLPLLAVYLAVQVGGQASFDEGMEAAGTVTRFSDFDTRRAVGVDGRTSMVKATMDLVSEPGDPMLMWTSYPWPYLNLERVSATRYIWKSFLLGEIYLGRTSEEYVLDGTWENFAADLEESDPTAFYVEAVTPVVPDTPFAAAVDDRFTTVFTDDVATLALRKDLVAWMTSAPVRPRPLADDSSGMVVLSRDRCVRLDADLLSDGTEPMRIEFGAIGNPPAVLMLSPGPDSVLVESHRRGSASWLQRVTVSQSPTSFTVIVGERAAVVLIDGQVVGAIDLPDDGATTITSGRDSMVSASISAPGPESGCS